MLRRHRDRPALTGCPEGTVELARRDRIDAVAPGKEPASGSGFAIIVAQKFKQTWRQHDLPILEALGELVRVGPLHIPHPAKKDRLLNGS
jgi:hypothetical protein